MILLIFLLINLFAVTIASPTPRCPPNMVKSEENSTVCYWFVETTNTFHQAESFCKQNGGHLTPVFDQFTNFFISVNAHSKFNNFIDFWIGGNVNISISGSWTWTWNYALMIYTDWQVNEPNSKYRCVASNINSALWTAQDCKLAKPFVCQIPAVVDVCDPEWSYFKARNQDGMCYKYVVQPSINFSTAQGICLNQSANLVSIHNDEENAFISRIAAYASNQSTINEAVFIGLQYQNWQWNWLDGTEITYENWAPYRPDNQTYKIYAFIYPEQAYGQTIQWSQKWDNYYSYLAINRFVCKKRPSLVFTAEQLL